jgi:outer membrane protein OmpA-like peptidoglycan-associated protein
MANFINSIKGLVTPQMVSQAARTLGEKEAGISRAVSMIVPGLLGIILKKRNNSSRLENILHEAGNLNILGSRYDNLCEEKPTVDQSRISDDFLQDLLGDKAADFTNPIADKAGISRVATNRLVSMLAPIVSGYLGNKLIRENWTKAQLFNEIEKEKSDIKAALPASVIKSFGLESTLGIASVPATKTKNNSWIVWVVIILLILLLFLAWRSCKNEPAVVEQDVVVTESVANNGDDATTNNRLINYSLPNGTVIRLYRNGVEERIVDFLNSNKYKNATDKDLQSNWFEFEDVNFEYGSATNLRAGSDRELNNIASILKAFPDAKIKIGAFADQKGTDETNLAISQERAKTIEKLLAEKGVGNQVITVQGYGEKYASHNINESNDARAEDRDIALRFVK